MKAWKCRATTCYTPLKHRVSYVEQQLQGRTGPVIAATDYIRNYADQIREYVPSRYVVLGTDGFGRSDSRANLREFFEVDRYHVVVAALSALARRQSRRQPRCRSHHQIRD